MANINALTNRIANQINAYRNDMGALKDLQWNLEILRDEGPKFQDLYDDIMWQISNLVEDGILDVDDLYEILGDE